MKTLKTPPLPIAVRPAPELWRVGDGRSLSVIMATACDCAGIPVDLALAQNRTRAVAFRRFQVFRVLRQRGWSLLRIARHTRHDHTTVLHGLKRAPQVLVEVWP